jgi:NOL1/NOP2/fmu family ribosome biogenesis protein
VGDLARAVRLWPHTAPGEGHFIAVMRRHGDATSPMPKPWRPARLPRPVETAYRHFWAANMTAEPISDRLALIGSYLYVLPAALPDLAGLRFLHPGWWLGTIKKDRFEPSHALALGLSPNAAHCAARLADDTRIIAFLRGQPFTDPGEDSWALVCVDSHPLGWGKRVAGVIKSHYPRGLRWV